MLRRNIYDGSGLHRTRSFEVAFFFCKKLRMDEKHTSLGAKSKLTTRSQRHKRSYKFAGASVQILRTHLVDFRCVTTSGSIEGTDGIYLNPEKAVETIPRLAPNLCSEYIIEIFVGNHDDVTPSNYRRIFHGR